MSGVLRVEWLPGSDRLRGRCHCGALAEGEDPAEMWEWLHAHPSHDTVVLRTTTAVHGRPPAP